MRETKFRGFSDIFGRFIYGNLIKDKNGINYIIPFECFSADGHHLHYDGFDDMPVFIKQDTIGQFTGIYDKDRKAVYVGDIIKVFSNTGRYPVVFNSDVVFENGVFGIYDGYEYKELYSLKEFLKATKTKYISDYGVVGIEFEPIFKVIGNIYENPELLEG